MGEHRRKADGRRAFSTEFKRPTVQRIRPAAVGRLNRTPIPTVSRPRLPWPLYDQNRNLLLPSGSVIQTEQHLDTIAESGLHRYPDRGAQSGEADAPGKSADSAQAGQGHYTLDDLKLPVGDNLQLQTRSERRSTRYYVKVIGYVKGHSL